MYFQQLDCVPPPYLISSYSIIIVLFLFEAFLFFPVAPTAVAFFDVLVCEERDGDLDVYY